MLLEDSIGGVAVVLTILQFLSGVLVCQKYVKNQTTGESSPLPFLTGVLSGFLWLLYGIAKGDGKIITVNVVGTSLMTLYSVVFYVYTSKKASMLKQSFILIFLIGCSLTWNHLNNDDIELVISGLGMAASIVTLLTIGSPMCKLTHVIKTKNTECLPLPLIFMSSLVSFAWFFYGIVVKDMILLIVNLVGLLIALAQLLLFVIYPRRPYLPISKDYDQALASDKCDDDDDDNLLDHNLYRHYSIHKNI